jgi:ABC-type transporter Mla subunit MlaD
MARIPGIDSVFSVLQAQTEALSALPAAVSSLTGAVRSLTEVVGQARETVQAFHRLAVRADAIVAELEEPLRDLAPGLRRLAVVLDDPVVDDLPATLRQVQDDVLPVLRTLAETHERVAVIAGSTERIMGFVDDAGRSFAGLSGAALLGRRRPAPRVVDQDPPG